MATPSKTRYRLNFWNEVVTDDGTSELMNVLGMILSMVGILLKYKSCAWFGLLVAGVGFANVRANYDTKQILSTFMLSLSAVVMCYLTNPQPISAYLMTPLAGSSGTSTGSLDVTGKAAVAQ